MLFFRSKKICESVFLVIVTFHFQFAISGSDVLAPFFSSGSSSIFASQLWLIPKPIDDLSGIVSLPKGGQDSNSKVGTTSESSGAGGGRQSSIVPVQRTARAGKGLSGSGGNGEDPPPPRDNKNDKPEGAYYIAPDPTEDEATIELVSTSPLIFRIKIKKNSLASKKLNSNTPWIRLTSRAGGPPAHISLHIGKPEKTDEEQFYRVFPLLRIPGSDQSLRLGSCGVFPKICLKNQELIDAANSDQRISLFLGAYPEESFQTICLLRQGRAITKRYNTVTDKVGCSVNLDTVPTNLEGFNVALTSIPQQSADNTYRREFSFKIPTPDYNAYFPNMGKRTLAEHLARDHDSSAGGDDPSKLLTRVCFDQVPLQQILKNPEPVESCKQCQTLYSEWQDYKQWKENWNQAAEHDDTLVFDVEIKFHFNDEDDLTGQR